MECPPDVEKTTGEAHKASSREFGAPVIPGVIYVNAWMPEVGGSREGGMVPASEVPPPATIPPLS